MLDLRLGQMSHRSDEVRYQKAQLKCMYGPFHKFYFYKKDLLDDFCPISFD